MQRKNTKKHIHIRFSPKSAAPALLLACLPALAMAQSDDFSSKDDTAWTRQDPIYQAYPDAGPQATFSFPAGGYHIRTEPSPDPANLGPGRGGALREDVTYLDNFYVAVDLLNWTDTNQMVASVVARISNPGPGSTSGYLFGYTTPSAGASQGQLGIYVVTGENNSALNTSSITLTPTNSYRLAFFGQGNHFEGRVYQLPNTNTPAYTLSATDDYSAWSGGFSGLAQADQSEHADAATDVTYGHYYATDFCICDQPQNVSFRPGWTVNLSASAVGPAGISYQWKHYGTNIADNEVVSGSTTPTLTLNNATADLAGPYTLVVTDSTTPERNVSSATAAVSVLAAVSPDLSIDFESSLPAGTSIRGTAQIDTDNASGHALHLTDAVNSQQGSFVVSDRDTGAVVRGFDAQFDALIGGSTTSPSADGLCFAWSKDLPATDSFGEAGSGTGLTVIFEAYDNNSSIPGPGIVVKYQGEIVATQPLELWMLENYPNFVPVEIRLAPGGLLTVVCNYQYVWNNLPIPGLAGGMAGASFGWGARTGLFNDNFWIDNVRLSTNPKIVSLSPTTTPAGVSITYSGVLQSATNVAGPYTDVPQATSPCSFLIPQDGTQMFWRVRSP
jgi:hypothetical protein